MMVDPNILITGHLDHDKLYNILLNKKKVAKSKGKSVSKYLLKPDNPIILIGVPQLLEHSILSAKDHLEVSRRSL